MPHCSMPTWFYYLAQLRVPIQSMISTMYLMNTTDENLLGGGEVGCNERTKTMRMNKSQYLDTLTSLVSVRRDSRKILRWSTKCLRPAMHYYTLSFKGISQNSCASWHGSNTVRDCIVATAGRCDTPSACPVLATCPPLGVKLGVKLLE